MENNLLNFLPNEILVMILDNLDFEDQMNVRLVNSKMNDLIDIFNQKDGKELVKNFKVKNPVAVYDRLKTIIANEIYYYLMDNYKQDEEDVYHANYSSEDINKKSVQNEIHAHLDKLYPLFRSDLENHLILVKNKILLNPKSYNFIKNNDDTDKSMEFLFPNFNLRLNQLIVKYFHEYDDVFFDKSFLENSLFHIKNEIIRALVNHEFGKNRKF
jgi:hypothetical protein